MFTKEDFIEYFGQLASVEREMIYRVRDTLDHLTDPAIRAPLERILSDECRHYMLVKNVLEDIFHNKEHVDRSSLGVHTLGTVVIQEETTQRVVQGFCLRSTETLLYVECAANAPLTGKLNVTLSFFDHPEQKNFVGEMDWFVQVVGNIAIVRLRRV